MKGYTHWSPAEDAILAEHYPRGGALACRRNGLKRPQASMSRRAKKLGINSTQSGEEPAWAVPAQSLLESLDCIRLRKWRGPVDRTRALRAAA